MYRAWHVDEVRSAVAAIVRRWEDVLPACRDARIVLKPNLNNDLIALTGNSTDPRVLDALLGELRARDYTDLVVADGSNVGVERRGIDTHRRLRVRPLAERHGARAVDLNRDSGRPVALRAGARPRIAETVLKADLLIGVPTLKTHAEAGLSCALKNQVGVCVAQDKRAMHRDLAANIHALAGVVRPRRILVDALVAMQGNGPGDGDPVRLDALIDGDDPWLVDLVAARIAGLDARGVPYLRHALEDGTIDETLLAAVESAFPVWVRVRPPPPRGWLARIADTPALQPVKVAVRPLTDRPEIADAAYRLGVLQDVYDMEDDTLRLVGRRAETCAGCAAPCAAVCPTGLALAEIGVRTELPDCTQCLHCWWACPRGALRVEGEPRAMARQLARYRAQVAALVGAGGPPGADEPS